MYRNITTDGETGMADRYLKVPEAADRLAIGRTHAYDLITRGLLPHVRIGRSVRIPERALEEYLAARTVIPDPGQPAGRR